MTAINLKGQRTLQVALYSGIALIVVSMLFLLGQSQADLSFFGQAVAVLAVPAFFYGAGVLVYRYLKAPLAGPGIIATGAWLTGVSLIHLYVRRILLPDVLQPYYWLGASLFAAGLITLTGHRVRIWMLTPLVPLVQANALWAVMIWLGVPVAWMPALSFVWVLFWWHVPVKDERWQSIYRASAAVLAGLLLLFAVWLPLSTPQTLLITWAIAAGVSAYIGLKQRWMICLPLTVALLTCGSVWGLSARWWPLTWLTLGAGTIIFILWVSAHLEKPKAIRGVDLALALGVLLSGAAVLLAQLSPFTDTTIAPLETLGLSLAAALLFLWLGTRRQLLTAIHAGLWLLAATWAMFYSIIVPSGAVYGLWLALFAACVLLVQRLLSTRRKEKVKSVPTLLETMTYWPGADLAIGLSAVIFLWTATQISGLSPWVSTTTFAIVIGIWISAALIYRIPVLLHLALWAAPVPYALLLIVLAPSLWTLPLLGIAWQVLGVALLIIGHSAPRYRPALLAPFFIVGYLLLAFGLIIAAGNPDLMLVSLLILVIASIATSVAIIFDYHPAWSVFVEWIAPVERRPYAHKNLLHAFLFLSAWLSAIWLHLMLGYSGLALPRQGIFLVGFACIWFLLGRLLARIPGVVGWPVLSAGWLMWLIGLLEVFFSPTEALITVVLGLITSGEALRRTRELYWLLIFILQLIFTALQISLLLSLPAHSILLVMAICLSAIGMIYERHDLRAGRLTAVIGALLALGIWCLHPDLSVTLAVFVLAIIPVLVYRDWRWMWAIYLGVAVLTRQIHLQVQAQALLAAGVVQWIIGAELIRARRPRRFRTLQTMVIDEYDWATPLLWVGTGCILAALFTMFQHSGARDSIQQISAASFALVALLTTYSIRLRVFRLPYVALLMVGSGLIGVTSWSINQPMMMIGNTLFLINLSLVLAALFIRSLCLYIIKEPRQLRRFRWFALWIRPLLLTTLVLGAFGMLMFFTIGTFYQVSAVIAVANGVALAIFAALLYSQQQRLVWLGSAVGMASISWLILLGSLGLHSPIWLTLPLGLVLLVLAKTINHPERINLEAIGSLIWFIGCVASLEPKQPLSLASLGAAVHLVSLIGYGLVFNRRIPLVTGLFLALGGVIYGISKINVWIIPLIGGLLLVSGALLLEVKRETAERVLGSWVTYWKRLK